MENLLLLFAAILIPPATVFYIQSIRIHSRKPHLGSWILYPALEIATGIAAIMNGTPKVAIIPFVFAAGGIVTLTYMIIKRKYTTGTIKELWISVALGIAGAFIGIFINDYLWSQAAFLAGTFIASYLTLKIVWKDPYSEDGRSWAIWCLISILFVIGLPYWRRKNIRTRTHSYWIPCYKFSSNNSNVF